MRVVTWNMQGGKNVPYLIQVINNTQPDVLCLQETGNLQANLHPVVVLNAAGDCRGQYRAGHGVWECMYWRNNPWPQGGLAVMSRLPIHSTGIVAAILTPPFVPPNRRSFPWIRLNHPVTGVAKKVHSVHSPPVWNPHPTIVEVCTWNNAQINNINVINGALHWMICGDFNADPGQAGYFVSPVPLPIIHGPHATQQGGGTIDYAKPSFPGIAYVARGALIPAASDHYPQAFDI